MPAVAAALALLVRTLIQAAVQTGIFIALSKLIEPLTDYVKDLWARTFDLTEEEAQDSIANQVIDAFAMVGILGVGIKSKIPTKVAEKLGFTSRGYVKRTLSAKTEAKLATAPKVSTVGGITTAAEVEQIATAVSKSRGISLATIKSVLGIVATVVGVPTGFFFAFAQYIDFANWQGPYQKTFQNLLSKIGINPDSPMPKASVVSAEIWKRIYSTIEELDPIGISFPFSGKDTPYSRLNLADLVDEVAANMAVQNISTSYKNVLGTVLPLVQLSGKSKVTAGGETLTNLADPGAMSSTTKVFTGVISAGKLGAGLEFVARPDDLIQDLEELYTAATNNLSAYLASLPARVIYEIKLVSTVMTADGFRQTGTSRQIPTTFDQYGRQRYKTVVNKFAIADIFIVTDKGNRTKIKTIVLGPTDALKFQPNATQIANVQNQLAKNISTSDPNYIDVLVTKTPTQIVAPAPAPAPAPVVPTQPSKPPGWIPSINANSVTYTGSLKILGDGSGKSYLESDGGYILYTGPSNAPAPAQSSAPAPAPTGTVPPPPTPSKANTATTLFDFYAFQGKTLPSIQERSNLYQSLGLGQASFYTGTAEQNTKLLNKLLGK